MNPETFIDILEKISSGMEKQSHCTSCITQMKKLLVTIRCYSCCNFYNYPQDNYQTFSPSKMKHHHSLSTLLDIPK
jgi:hypothetical protein